MSPPAGAASPCLLLAMQGGGWRAKAPAPRAEADAIDNACAIWKKSLSTPEAA